MIIFDAKGRRVLPGELLPKLSAYFADAPDYAQLSDLMTAIEAKRVTENRIPACGLLIRAAIDQGLTTREELDALTGVR
jgi:hypothetical protein